MKTEKKNQHYIPKFYLRNFSFHENNKQIGIYNIDNEFFFQKAKLKKQGAQNFFYGCDGIIEDKLSDLEGYFATSIRNIIDNKILPKKYSEEHFIILSFIALTDLRNPIKVEGIKNMVKGMQAKLLELDPTADLDKIVPNPSHEEVIELLLSLSSEMVNVITDLNYKLLINKTKAPFIASDFPIVKYNQFLEQEKWPHSKTGYSCVGLQIFIPLNQDLAIVFYDSAVYKVSDKKKAYLEITNKKDIDSINTLQYINCFKTIFFNDKANEHYIRSLAKLSKKYKRANETTTELSYLIGDNINEPTTFNGKENLMITGTTDCECRLKVNGIKIHSRGRSYRFTNSVVQIRPNCKRT